MNQSFSLLASAVFFLACSGQHPAVELTSRILPELPGETVRLMQHAAANPTNPLDSVGQWHNAFLQSLRSYEDASGDTTRNGQNKHLEQLSKQNWATAVRLTAFPEMESRIRKDYKEVLLTLPVSGQARDMLKQMVAILEGIASIEDYSQYKLHIEQVERRIQIAQLSEKEKGLLWITASMLRHSGYYWMEEFSKMPGSNARTSGFLRKLFGAICSTGADVTTAAYHYVKNTRPDGIILEASRMSYICGYYTGWYDNAW